jgi:hypothetical protein
LPDKGKQEAISQSETFIIVEDMPKGKGFSAFIKIHHKIMLITLKFTQVCIPWTLTDLYNNGSEIT